MSNAESEREGRRGPSSSDVIVWALIPAGIVAIAFAFVPLRSWDFWWHAALGRMAAVTGAIPTSVHFLYTVSEGTSTLIQPWLAQRLFHEILALGGLPMAIVLRNVWIALGFFFITVACIVRARSLLRGSIHAVVAGVLLVVPVLDLEPGLLMWPVFGGLLWLAHRARAGRGVFLVPIIFPVAAAVWANTDPWFTLPAILAGIFGGLEIFFPADEERSWRAVGMWAVVAALSLAAVALNPHGFELMKHQGEVHAHPMVHQLANAWAPTTLSHPPVAGLMFWGAMVFGGLLALLRRRVLEPEDLALFVIFAAMAVFAAGGIYWFAIVWAVNLAPAWRDLDDIVPDRLELGGLGRAAIVVVTLAGASALQPTTEWHLDLMADVTPYDVRHEFPLKALVPAETPVEATETIRVWGGAPRVFHDRRFAGFLLYHVAPDRPSRFLFADPRIHLLTEKQWELYRLILESNVWRGVFKQHDVRAVVLDRGRQSHLVNLLREANDWKMAIESHDHVLFVSR